MGTMIKLNCYIQEYNNDKGNLCARLREKESDKKVIMIGGNVNRTHLLMFLSQVKLNQTIMPTIYERKGNDFVVVRGVIESQNDEEIIVNIDVEEGGYLVE